MTNAPYSHDFAFILPASCKSLISQKERKKNRFLITGRPRASFNTETFDDLETTAIFKIMLILQKTFLQAHTGFYCLF